MASRKTRVLSPNDAHFQPGKSRQPFAPAAISVGTGAMYFVATNQVGELEAEKVWQARQRYHVIGRDSSLPLGLSRRGIMVTVVLVRMLKQPHEGRHLEGDMLGPGRQTSTSAANWIASPYRCQV